MIGPHYLEYPLRGHRLDHERFPMRYLRNAPKVTWPGGAPLALWVTVPVEFFPMNMGKAPFVPVGGVDKPYPGVWDYAGRDYGNRVGIFRLMEALAGAGLKATAAVNSVAAERYPALLAEIVACGWEVAASGTDMGEILNGTMPEEEEQGIVSRSVSFLREASGQPVKGWHSPGYSQSFHTPDILAAHGIRYATDWVNDDMPYGMATRGGTLLQMPLTWFLSDWQMLFVQNQRSEEYEAQILAAARALRDEAARAGGGRILSLVLTPYVMGQPHRMATLRRMLGALTAEGVWAATGAEIAEAWTAQTGS
jgi:allantoinase